MSATEASSCVSSSKLILTESETFKTNSLRSSQLSEPTQVNSRQLPFQVWMMQLTMH